jgi:hypothetical protein
MLFSWKNIQHYQKRGGAKYKSKNGSEEEKEFFNSFSPSELMPPIMHLAWGCEGPIPISDRFRSCRQNDVPR